MKICQKCSYLNIECTTDDIPVQMCMYHQCNGYDKDIYSNFTLTKQNHCKGFINMTDNKNTTELMIQELSDVSNQIKSSESLDLEALYEDNVYLHNKVMSLQEEMADLDWYVNILEDKIQRYEFMYSNIL